MDSFVLVVQSRNTLKSTYRNYFGKEDYHKMRPISLSFSILAAMSISGSLMASPICPVTANTNTDCGFIITIGSGGSLTGVAVAGASPYDGSDDALIGIVNNSGSTFTGAITLMGSGNGGGLFGFDGDGICTFAGLFGSGPASAYSYCSANQTAGFDPGDYQGPINTFSNIHTTTIFDDTGTVNVTGLLTGASTFFSVESAPNSFVPVITGGSPEPGTMVLLGSGLIGMTYFVRRRRHNR
jgi:hypothetical protein